jgi:hypothetical protein
MMKQLSMSPVTHTLTTFLDNILDVRYNIATIDIGIRYARRLHREASPLSTTIELSLHDSDFDAQHHLHDNILTTPIKPFPPSQLLNLSFSFPQQPLLMLPNSISCYLSL